VTAIAGPASADATFEGDGGHAGGVLMSARHDAVLAGAEFVLEAERAALSTGSSDTVSTSGVFSVEPGAENSIGRRVRVSLDVRDVDGARRDGVVAACRASATAIGSRRGVSAVFHVRSQDAPAQCAPPVVAAAEDAARRLGYRHRRLPSRAYHDALLMARRFPTGMLFSALSPVSEKIGGDADVSNLLTATSLGFTFSPLPLTSSIFLAVVRVRSVPCRDGISHHWREYASATQIERGILTLAHTLASLAGSAAPELPIVRAFAEQDEL
jgi:acetylornithine deacetylase/succinyl-diaminopimelate desuccinylase-like protein